MTRWYWPFSLIITIAAVIITAAVYSRMPEIVPIHWNIRGEVDGYGSRAWAFMAPGIMVAMLILFRLIPWLSPKNYSVDTFRDAYEAIVLIITLMFAYIHGLLLLAFLGIYMNNARALIAGIFLFFALLGTVLGKVRRNYYVGVRTPWTLASERVWNDTHRVAAWAFILAGLAGCAASLVGLPLWLPVVFILPAALGPVLYSLVLYKQLERRGEL